MALQPLSQVILNKEDTLSKANQFFFRQVGFGSINPITDEPYIVRSISLDGVYSVHSNLVSFAGFISRNVVHLFRSYRTLTILRLPKVHNEIKRYSKFSANFLTMTLSKCKGFFEVIFKWVSVVNFPLPFLSFRFKASACRANPLSTRNTSFVFMPNYLFLMNGAKIWLAVFIDKIRTSNSKGFSGRLIRFFTLVVSFFHNEIVSLKNEPVNEYLVKFGDGTVKTLATD